jgi:signal transduction histidine kinase
LRETAERMSEGGPVIIEVDISGQEFLVPEVISGNLLLMAQEAVTNALKHARPERIVIRVKFGEDCLMLSVTDDGSGFDTADVPGHLQGHFGLQGMRERAKRIGALMTIDSTPGNGCAIQVVLSSDCLDIPNAE